jgi:hypothetical protein
MSARIADIVAGGICVEVARSFAACGGAEEGEAL